MSPLWYESLLRITIKWNGFYNASKPLLGRLLQEHIYVHMFVVNGNYWKNKLHALGFLIVPRDDDQPHKVIKTIYEMFFFQVLPHLTHFFYKWTGVNYIRRCTLPSALIMYSPHNKTNLPLNLLTHTSGEKEEAKESCVLPVCPGCTLR